MARTIDVIAFAVWIAICGCDREPPRTDIQAEPAAKTPPRASSSPSPPKPDRANFVIIDRTTCARLGVSIDDVLAALRSAKITIIDVSASTEGDTPTTIVRVDDVAEPAVLMATRIGDAMPTTLAQVARLEVRGP